jgi:hypothetical protein
MSKKIYLCYAPADLEAAEGVLKALEGAGIRCWLKSRDLADKKASKKNVEKAIKNAAVMVVVFTNNTNQVVDLGSDMNIALNADLKIVPLRMTGAEPERVMQYYLADTQWLDISMPLDSTQTAMLVETVKDALQQYKEKRAIKKLSALKAGFFYPWPINIVVAVIIAALASVVFMISFAVLGTSIYSFFQAINDLVRTF